MSETASRFALVATSESKPGLPRCQIGIGVVIPAEWLTKDGQVLNKHHAEMKAAISEQMKQAFQILVSEEGVA